MRCHAQQRAAQGGVAGVAPRARCAARAAPLAGCWQPRGTRLVARVSTGDGVQDLLARDRKKQQQEPAVTEFDLPPPPSAEAPATTESPPQEGAEADAGGRRGRGGGRLKSRAQRRRDMAASSEDAVAGRGCVGPAWGRARGPPHPCGGAPRRSSAPPLPAGADPPSQMPCCPATSSRTLPKAAALQGGDRPGAGAVPAEAVPGARK